ncbi:triacylglycerol lipase OBL1 [Vicia villosa]|uniref:triacylglycerol lipase OBL1 n=1 Tax=Vicia villosa TaxID=3911 RepID=UPI00273A9CEF|nr:triacylglycerol lipase OBL1 [Vicia villosa]
MDSEQSFYKDYLLLKPKEASVFELCCFLCSSNTRNRGFIDCSEGLEVREFGQRWFLFISVVAQKVLVALEPLLKIVGDMLELWLNRIASNGGFIRLFFNILKGEMITPEKSSAEFLTVVGHLDPRVNLDKNIHQNDPEYKALLSIMASKFAYENEQFISTMVTNHWGMELLGQYSFWNDYQKHESTKAMIIKDTKSEPNLILVAFRGTIPFDAEQWKTDIDISWFDIPNVGKIHGGFMKALGLLKNRGWPKQIDERGAHRYAYYSIREELRAVLRENEDAKFILTGHSLGGALAILFIAVLIFHEEEWLLEKLEGVYTFGQPRVGDQKFGEFMKSKMKMYDVKCFRYVYCNDLVPRVPYDDQSLFYKHFSPCLYYNSLYQGKVLEEEPNKNYYSLLWVIPKMLNAVWEVIRGFLLPFFVGKDYKQNWFMVMFRFVGLTFPGVPAHFPTDYVTSVRLGSFDEHPELQDFKDD